MLLYKDLRSGSSILYGKWMLGTALLFLLPTALSLLNSIDLSRSGKYLLELPLFIIVGYYIHHRFKSSQPVLPLLLIMAATATLWGIFSFWQFLLPELNPFPEPRGGRFQGLFGRSDMVLGYVLAGIAPFLIFGFWEQRWKKSGIVLFAFLVATCFISGNRASWVSMILVITVLPLVALVSGWRPKRLQVAIGVVLTILSLVLGAYAISGTALEKRLSITLKFFEDPSFDTFQRSSGGRGDIWRSAFEAGMDNPLTGIGAANFRLAHPDYMTEAEQKKWIKRNKEVGVDKPTSGAFYPHQIVLQQFAGTGFLGLVGLLIFYACLVFVTVKAIRSSNWMVVGATIAIWSAYFPLNTHLNFHQGWLTANFWVWIGLLFGLMRAYNHSRECGRPQQVSS